MNPNGPSRNHVDLQATARQVMIAHGFEPEYPPQVQPQLNDLKAHPPLVAPSADVRDLRSLLWSSIDNDTSRDLDQIEVAEALPNGETKVMVGIADVDAFVAKNTPIDQHAAKETTTVYTGVRNFSMLPEQLSTGTTSLLEVEDELSVVIEFVVAADGTIHSGAVYRAVVHNKAQLAYNAVGAQLASMSLNVDVNGAVGSAPCSQRRFWHTFNLDLRSRPIALSVVNTLDCTPDTTTPLSTLGTFPAFPNENGPRTCSC